MVENVNEYLKEKRLELGLSQKELAEKAGVSSNTIYNIEKGNFSPNVSTYQKICKALNIKLADIL